MVMSGPAQLFPSAKVVGGFDFVGDAYTGGNTPVSDPNPEDCPSSLGGGHGSHVAGTLGGYGENADGSTYTGSYDGLNTKPMKIGPGVAPEVKLYAVRVFGCTGSTNLTVRALEWVADPNGDGNPADHLDVANLSLGSSFGAADDPSATAASAAVTAGVAVVISAGNGGDTTYQSGSPGSSPRALTVANMSAGETTDGFLLDATDPALDGVRPATESAAYDWAGKPPVTAQLVYPSGGQSTTGCSAYPAGTFTGKIVLLDWRITAGTAFPCGSATRASNVSAAGAVGVIMADPEVTYTTAITGIAAIPAMYTIKPTQDVLKAALAGGTTSVTMDHAYAQSGHDDSVAGTISTSSSRGSTGAGGLKPDIAAPGSGIRSTASGTGNGAEILTGTSMAAPAAAGTMALLRQRHPSWTVEELKALAMNTASRDIFTLPGQTGSRLAPQRVGAGTVQAGDAVTDDVFAYDAGAAGAVSASFGALEVPAGAPFTRERTITIVNRSGGARTYTPSFAAGTSLPGVQFAFPDGATVDVPAGGSASFRLRLSVPDPSALRNDRDPSMAATQNALINTTTAARVRAYLAEASGLVRLSSPGHLTLSVPAHASLRPVDTLQATRHSIGTVAPSGSTSVTFTGTAVQTGTGSTDFRSKITPLELQLSSPQITFPAGTPKRAAGADLRYVGVGPTNATNGIAGDSLTFGLSTWGRRASPGVSYGEFDIYLDTNRDGVDDRVIYNDRAMDGTLTTDVFAVRVLNISGGSFTLSKQLALPLSPFDTPAAGGVFDTDALTMTVPLTVLGLTPSSRFDYRVEAYTSVADAPVETTPTLTYDLAHPGVTFGAIGSGARDDVAGAFGFTYSQADLAANGSSGALLLHHLGATGKRAEAIRIASQSQPVASPGGPYVVTEGQAASLDARGSSDVDEDPLTFDWDLDDNATFETAGATTSSGVLPDGPATRTVHLRVGDGITTPVSVDVPLVVLNAAPTVTATVTGSPASGLRLVATDPSPTDQAAGFGYAIDFGADGSVEQTVTGGAQVDVPHAFPAGATTVRVTATDKDGAASAPVDVVATGPASTPPPETTPTTPTTPTSPTTPTTPATPATPKPPVVRCVVPKLKGKTLKQATAALKKARCALGKVTRPRRAKGTLVVSTQSVKAGRKVTRNTKVSVKLVVKAKKR
jgi:subtilisin family serine protease